MSTTTSNVICLNDIPYGFYEKELYGYFKQFGTVKRVRVKRSKKGIPVGIAYVMFENESVAEIAAETMDNYILAEKRLKCKVVDGSKLPKCILSGSLYAPIVNVKEQKAAKARIGLKKKTEVQENNMRIRLLKQMKSRMKKVKAMGIDYKFDYESKYEAFRKQKTAKKRILKTKEKRKKVESTDSDYNSGKP